MRPESLTWKQADHDEIIRLSPAEMEARVRALLQRVNRRLYVPDPEMVY